LIPGNVGSAHVPGWDTDTEADAVDQIRADAYSGSATKAHYYALYVSS